MRELRFEGLSDDGTRLVLVGKDGQRWAVVIDERVEAAVRRDRARMGQVEIERSGQLRPKEIQARILAGATSADIAAASGLPLEHVQRFERTPLDKRAWIADQARNTPLRRAGVEVTLGEQVTARLASQGVEASEITWDSWRPDEGLWTVIAAFPLGPNTHVATWQYDQATHTITPVDDNAEDLTSATAPARLRLVTSRPQLASVAPAGSPEPGSNPGDDLADAATEPPTSLAADPAAVAPGREDDGAAEHLTNSEDDPVVPPTRLVPVATDDSDSDTEPGSGPRGQRPKRPTRHPSGSQLPAKAEAAAPPAQADPPAGATGAEDALFESEPTNPVTPKPKPGRSAVPSFDDILFGPAPKR